MTERSITIQNRLGLHARAAARLVRKAMEYECDVLLIRKDTRLSVDGKSILGVLMLAASNGTNLTIQTDGPDEAAAADALVELVNSGFGEDSTDGAI